MSLIRASVVSWWGGLPLSTRHRRWCGGALVVVLVVIGLIVLTPGAPAETAQGVLNQQLDAGHASGRVPTSVTYDRIQWLANVVMFLPLGYLLAAVLRPGLRVWAIPTCVVLSSAVELAQRYWISGRVSSFADVLANSLGGLLGFVLLVWISGRLRAPVRR